MTSFYPGPSEVYSRIPRYVQEAHQAGVLSMNHRSAACMALVKQTIAELKKKLRIPKSYTILFLSSATECWEVLAQSLVAESSTHLYNGAFGKKWLTYTQALKPATAVPFHHETELPLAAYPGDVLCITHNETSNGTQVSMQLLKQLRQQNPKALLAIDATSSMAGVALDFSLGDVWFASVQKCFGLPAGLSVMVCSPRARARVQELNERQHYNSLRSQIQFMEKFQTTHTPNVLGIYLLYRVLQDLELIRVVSKRVHQQAAAWYGLLDQTKILQPFIKNKQVRSQTVVVVTANPRQIKQVKTRARKAGLLVGEGYGELNDTTFRIANFPAIKPGEIKKLMTLLKKLPAAR